MCILKSRTVKGMGGCLVTGWLTWGFEVSFLLYGFRFFVLCILAVHETGSACLMQKAEKEMYRKLNVFWVCPRGTYGPQQNDTSSSQQGGPLQFPASLSH